MIKFYLMILLSVFLLTGCGSDGESESSESSSSFISSTTTGTFIDDKVQGLRYINGSKTGFTDENGQFPYEKGLVEFFVGKIKIGEISSLPSDGKVFIQDVVGVDRKNISDTKVLKIAKFLQSLNSSTSGDKINISYSDSSLFTDNKDINDINISDELLSKGKILKSDDEVLEHLGATQRKYNISLFNYKPKSENIDITLEKNTITNGTLIGIDKNDKFLNYSIVNYPKNGILELIDETNVFKYIPNKDYVGNDDFTYRVYDGEKYSNLSTVNVLIKEPVASSIQDDILPIKPLIVSLNAKEEGITIFWLESTDNVTLPQNMKYEIHLSKDENFIINTNTLKQTLSNTLEADIKNLESNTKYYIKVKALDEVGNFSISDESFLSTLENQSIITNTSIIKKASDLHLESAKEESNKLIFNDSKKAKLPDVGNILIGNAEDKYLKKVVSVSKNNETTEIKTEDATITEIVEKAKISSKVVLFGSADTPSQQKFMKSSVRYKTNNTKEVKKTWASGRFGVSETVQLPSILKSKSTTNKNSGFEVTIVKDNIQVIQNNTIEIDIDATMLENGIKDDWKFTSIKLISLSHDGNKNYDNYGAWFLTKELKKHSLNGVLKWTPRKNHVSEIPYIAKFEIFSIDEDCGLSKADLCDEKSEIIESKITVIGDGKVDTGGETTKTFSSSKEFTNNITLDFTPTLTIDHEITDSDLKYAKVALNGKLDFDVLSTFKYDVNATKKYETQLITPKTYTSVYVVGTVPIYQEITYSIDAVLEAVADGSIHATSDLDTTFTIEAGLEYDGKDWKAIESKKLEKDYTATITAAGGVNVKVRLIPNVEVKFYKVASSGISIEPWLEGDLRASATVKLNTDFESIDTLGIHKIEKLDIKAGIDANVYADLSIWKFNIAHYPSEENDENGDGKKTIYKIPFDIFSIPNIQLSDNGIDICSNNEYNLNAKIENPNTLIKNDFEMDSIEWVVFPKDGAKIVTNSIDKTKATFTFTKQDEYEVYIIGNSSKLGSSVGKQYEYISIDTRPCSLDSISPQLSSTSKTFTTTVGTSLTLETVTANDNKDGRVLVSKSGSVDFNTIGTYEITYSAEDMSRNISSIVHTYIVTDIPDITAPVITTKSSYSFDENKKILIQAKATDESSMTFTLGGVDKDSFFIDPNTSIIVSNTTTNYESKKEYNITLIATDSSNNKSEKDIKINIKNIVEESDCLENETFENNQCVANPKIISFSPTQVLQNVKTTFTVTGENLPNTIAMAIDDCSDKVVDFISTTTATIECTPRVSGNKSFFIKDKSGGEIIANNLDMVVNVKEHEVTNTCGLVKNNHTLASLLFNLDINTTVYDNPGAVTAPYLMENYSQYIPGMEVHAGTDFRSKKSDGTAGRHEVYSLTDGEVVRADNGTKFGAVAIRLQNLDGETSLISYGHLDETNVSVGDSVKVGTLLGYTGDIGAPNAAHLHLEYRPNYNNVSMVYNTSCSDNDCSKEEIQGLTDNPIDILDLYCASEKLPVITTTTNAPKLENEEVTFTVNLSESLDSKYSVKIALGDNLEDNTSFLDPIEMSANNLNTIYTYSKSISVAGNRVYKVAIFDGDTRVSAWLDGTYIVNENTTPTDSITHNNFTYGIVTSPITGKKWLDRNLGANRVCKSFEDEQCFGDYYQWGRFSDGHEKASSRVTYTLSSDITDLNNKFIKPNTSDNNYLDWTDLYTDGNGSLRQKNWLKLDGSSICPTGFRVPKLNELKEELVSLNIKNKDDVFNSFFKFGNSSFKSFGLYSNGTDNGNLWTSSIETGINQNRQSRFITVWEPTINWAGGNRFIGLPIRCIADISETDISSTPTQIVLKTGQTTSYTDYDDGYYQKGVSRSYTRGGDIVIDQITKLQWQDDEETKSIRKTWEEAKTYCEDKNLGGHNDWRLPTIKELQTIVDDGKYSPSMNSIFENTSSNNYWSSTTSASYTSSAWYVDFYNGYTFDDAKTFTYYVRCVRAGQ